jgi:hypothetical protein
MKKQYKESIQVWTAIIMLVVGTLLVIAGFIVPPTGEVHDSVLWFFGECLIYAGSIFGISIYVSGKINNIRRELNLPAENNDREKEKKEQ